MKDRLKIDEIMTRTKYDLINKIIIRLSSTVQLSKVQHHGNRTMVTVAYIHSIYLMYTMYVFIPVLGIFSMCIYCFDNSIFFMHETILLICQSDESKGQRLYEAGLPLPTATGGHHQPVVVQELVQIFDTIQQATLPFFESDRLI